MGIEIKMASRGLAVLCALLTLLSLTSFQASAQQRGRDPEVPAGTILKLSMDKLLSSKDAQIGDPFTATLTEDVRIQGETVITKGAKVRGRVASVTPAQRGSKSGSIGVSFDQIDFSGNRTLNIEGQLTSLDEVEKRQIDEEGRVSGDSSSKRNVIFIGGGAAGGAAIGAIAGGGKGAGVGAAAGAGLGVLGALISKGEEAQVQPGQRFGVEILRPVRVPVSYLGNNTRDDRDNRDTISRDDRNSRDDRSGRDSRDNRDDTFGRTDDRRPTSSNRSLRVDPKSPTFIKRAQSELAKLNYYKGSPNGLMGTATKNSVLAFQRDRDLEQTGNIDFDTAYALELVDDEGYEIVPVRLLDADAIKSRDGSIEITGNAQTNTGGWRVFATSLVDRDILKVYVKGNPPQGRATQALSKYPFNTVSRNARDVRVVEIYGDGQPIVIELSGAGLALRTLQQIQRQTAQMLLSYREDIGASRRGSNEISDSSRLSDAQAEAISLLNTLDNSTNFAVQLLKAKASDSAIRGALSHLLREARQTRNRLGNLREFNRVERQWNDLERDLRTLDETFQIGVYEGRGRE